MKTNFKLICCCICLVVLHSCKKMVDAGDPLTTITTRKTFTTDATAYAALAGMYSMMMNGTTPVLPTYSNGCMTFYPGMSSDELINYHGAAVDADYSFTINKLNSRNVVVNILFWTPMYKLIFNANSIIEGVEESTSNQLTPAARKQITGEAKFMRAFHYFYLVNLFGDLPLVTGTDWKSNVQVRRSPVADVYRQIEKDLIEAQEALPADFEAGGGERIRASKFAATALLARVYLYTGDWKNAEIQSTNLISNSAFELETDLSQVFMSTSKESIWQLKPSLANPNYELFETTEFRPDLWWTDLPVDFRPIYLDKSVFPDVAFIFYPAYIMTHKLAGEFEQNDERLNVWTSFVETPMYAPYTGITDRFPNKYLKPATGKKYLTVFRLAEQYLIRAEARANLNNISGADADLNAVRRRAKLDNINSASREASLNAIAHERQTELFAEWGHRWFDLKRTGKALEELRKIPQKLVNATQLLYPIPEDEIMIAPSLVQNSGY